jgi:hypothetical protein
MSVVEFWLCLSINVNIALIQLTVGLWREVNDRPRMP